MKIFAKLTQLELNGSKTEKKIASFILNNANWIKLATTDAIAAKIGVSQSAVTKFIKRIEPRGFSFFKIALSESLITKQDKPLPNHGSIVLTDPIENIYQSLLNDTIKALNSTFYLCDLKLIEKVALKIKQANRIFIQGSGASAIVGQDFAIKLLKFGYHVFCYADPHVMLSALASAQSGDIALVISHSGFTKEALYFAKKAKEAELTVIALSSNPNSQIASYAELILPTTAEEGIARTASISSRTAQLFILDILFLALLHENVELSLDNINRARELTSWQLKP